MIPTICDTNNASRIWNMSSDATLAATTNARDRRDERGEIDGGDGPEPQRRHQQAAEEFLEDERGRSQPEHQRRLPLEQPGGPADAGTDDTGEDRAAEPDALQSGAHMEHAALEHGEGVADESGRDRGGEHEPTRDQPVDTESVGTERSGGGDREHEAREGLRQLRADCARHPAAAPEEAPSAHHDSAPGRVPTRRFGLATDVPGPGRQKAPGPPCSSSSCSIRCDQGQSVGAITLRLSTVIAGAVPVQEPET